MISLVKLISYARFFHMCLSYAMGFVLVFMALTGGIWAVAYRIFNYNKAEVKFLILWHQGDFMGIEAIRAPFCVAVGLGTIGMIVSGVLQMNSKSLLSNRNVLRRLHHITAICIALPLLVVTVTGSVWAVAK